MEFGKYGSGAGENYGSDGLPARVEQPEPQAWHFGGDKSDSGRQDPVNTLDLPGFRGGDITTLDSGVFVGTNADLVDPQLQLLDPRGGLEPKFDPRTGLLIVNEKLPQASQSAGRVRDQSTTIFGRHGTIHVGNCSGVVFGDNITMSSTFGPDGDVTIVSSSQGESGRASLLFPPNYPGGDIAIKTASGNVLAAGVNLQELRVATASGTIAVAGTHVDGNVRLGAMSGNVSADSVVSDMPVKLKSMSGNVTVNNSSAPQWKASSMSGNVSVTNTTGRIKPSSMSGDVDVR